MSVGAGEAEQAAAVVDRRRAPRAALSPPCSTSHSSRPGSTEPGPGRHHQALERREAHRRVDRPAAADRRQRGPGAEVGDDETQVRRGPASRPRGGSPRRTTARGTRSGAARVAHATRPAGRRYAPPRAGRVEGGVEAGHCRQVRAPLAGRPRSRRAPRAGAAGRGSSARAGRRASRSSTTPGRTWWAPPCTTRWPTASAGTSRSSACSRRDEVVGRGSTDARATSSSAPRTRSLTLLDPVLTVRTRIRRQPVTAPSAHCQSRIVRGVLAVLAGVGAVAQPLVDHLLAQRSRRGTRARAPGR